MAEKRFDILAVGGCGMDIIMHVNDIMHFEMTDRRKEVHKYTALEFSAKCAVKSVRYMPGGSAANVAVDARSFGMRSAYMGKIGMDGNGTACMEDLEHNHVNIEGLRRTAEDTTAVSVVLLTSFGADRSILAYKGTTNLLRPEDIDENLCRQTRCLVWTSLTSASALAALEKAIDIAKASGAKICGAPSMAIIQQFPEVFDRLIRKTDILSMNDDELKAFTAKPTILAGVQYLLECGLKLVSITFGDKGSLVTDGVTVAETPVCPIQVEDTTGAGDAFATGLICGYLQDKPVERLALEATAIAAMEVSALGVRCGIPRTMDELQEFINHHPVTQSVFPFETALQTATGLLGRGGR